MLSRSRIMLASLLLVLTVFASAQEAEKLRLLKPPAGAKVAIVEFEDFECPDCARAHPLVMEATQHFHIPLVRYDFPLPQHAYALQAAIMDRFLETKSKALAAQFRDDIFKAQPSLADNADNYRTWVAQWAQQHNVQVPFLIDPTGKFTAAIKADQDLGRRINIEHTPTIYIVTANRSEEPFVEVADRTQFFQMIEDAIQKAGGATESAAKKTSHR